MTTPNDDSYSLPQPSEEAAELRPRPHVLSGATYRALTPIGTAFVTINSDAEGDVREVFITVGRAGSDIAADAEALGRLISLAFRIPTSLTPHQVVEAIIDQLSGIGGSSSLGYGAKRVRSLADAVAQVLVEHSGMAELIPSERGEARSTEHEGEPNQPGAAKGNVGQAQPLRRRDGDFCPDCGQMTLVNEEGCRTCRNCGHSSC